MSIKRIIVLTIITLVLSSTAFAQGEFLRKGESGFGASAHYAFDSVQTTYGFGGSLCLEGQVELGLNYAYNDETELEITSPSLTVYIKGQGYSTAPGLALTVAYAWLSGDSQSKSEYVSIGAAGFMNYAVSDVILLQPSFSCSISFDQPEESYRSETALLGVAFSACLNHGNLIRPFMSAGLAIPLVDGADRVVRLSGGIQAAW